MKQLHTVILILSGFIVAPTVLAKEVISYRLEVEGMLCAFCAYKTAKQLTALPAIDPDSISVDLKQGKIQFTATHPLQQSSVQQAVEQAGFKLTAMEAVADAEIKDSHDWELALRIEIPIAAVRSEQVSTALGSLGKTFAQKPGLLIVEAPETLENWIMRPLLMGRSDTYPVRFEQSVTKDNPVILHWLMSDASKAQNQ